MDSKYKEIQFDGFVWIDICNPNMGNLDKIAKDYNLDYFQIRDSLETGHLPKYEKQENYKFLILRAFTANLNDRITNISELSNKIAFFFSDKKVITIHRWEFDFLKKLSKIPISSEDLVIYFIHKMSQTFEQPSKLLGDKNDEIEKTIFLKDYTKISLEDLYYQKTQTRITKKLLHITQNVINQMEVSEQSKTALQDVKDTMLSLVLNYDEVLENSHNLLNTYLSVNAQKSNDVMKLLTIFSAFFLPLTFIGGIYGMNFENMPELRWQFGYFITLGVMALVALIIYVWFKRKKII
jgi:magnesium transporter